MDLTQEALAEDLGVSVETVSHLERGATSPSLKSLLAVATVLKMDLATVFAGLPVKPREISTARAELEAKLRHAGVSFDDVSLRLLVDLTEAVGRNAAGKGDTPAKG